MNRCRRARSRLLALVSTATIALAVACGGSAPVEVPITSAASTPAAATVAPTETPLATVATAATATVTPGGRTTSADDLAVGREIFNTSAGGVGCAFCHGADGEGDGPAMVGAPPNRGATEEMVRNALDNVAMMSNIKLTSDEIKAVAAYLAYLAERP